MRQREKQQATEDHVEPFCCECRILGLAVFNLLEDKLPSKLKNPGIQCGSNLPEGGGAGQRSPRIAQTCGVEGVERLCTEFEPHALFDLKISRDRRIEVPRTGAEDR